MTVFYTNSLREAEVSGSNPDGATFIILFLFLILKIKQKLFQQKPGLSRQVLYSHRENNHMAFTS